MRTASASARGESTRTRASILVIAAALLKRQLRSCHSLAATAAASGGVGDPLLRGRRCQLTTSCHQAKVRARISTPSYAAGSARHGVRSAAPRVRRTSRAGAGVHGRASLPRSRRRMSPHVTCASHRCLAGRAPPPGGSGLGRPCSVGQQALRRCVRRSPAQQPQPACWRFAARGGLTPRPAPQRRDGRPRAAGLDSAP